ncbi:hypothetical protein HZH68_013383 [Vespula germanica]|uniref:Uncharacterized protein n=1 Tax=Vespula germanica TaxID=30212 RepID=A0A834JIT9_VESGE|nr:hypothetical protein HZH68_013383 [Vespula germanica]
MEPCKWCRDLGGGIGGGESGGCSEDTQQPYALLPPPAVPRLFASSAKMEKGSEQPSKNEKKKGGRGGGTRCPRAVALQLEEKEEKVEEEEEEEDEDEEEEEEEEEEKGATVSRIRRIRSRFESQPSMLPLERYRPAGSLSSCCHGDAQVNLTWANSQRHTDARYAIPLFIWFLHGGSYFPATSPPCVGTRLS